jgi:hypothetical protein
MLLGLLNIRWLITGETNNYKKILNDFFIKNTKRGRCGKPSGPPNPLGKEQSHCSFCATALR